MNNDIQVIKTNGSFNLFVNKDEKKVSYQSLESVVDEFNLTLEENASLELLTFNNGSTNNVKLNAHLAKGATLTVYNMVITGKKAKIGDMVINSGDYITLNVPYYGAPAVYKGAANLVQPNPDKLGLFDIVDVCKKHCVPLRLLFVSTRYATSLQTQCHTNCAPGLDEECKIPAFPFLSSL